ncbi:class I SAM-dependent methyltransferase [Flavobacterium sp. MC2016-06]|jgi:SAM-dependent methyltransferase|uniref:class I SAM-dependent methyltransferase n=1 Tax=Flavobacterium sp. MC2016-06 TaxID=2676308 RepID=UPI0012BB0519|nr:class I SAM-dependent methyltransferase [Flavobacterium sp. MC2016-06]MBU3858658.1 class I SAM-dependent methyltransferase [Flavobacterium sp. MC2016-06]
MGANIRTENVGRLSSVNIDRNNIYYLHYKSYHDELFKAIKKYAKGDVLDIGCGNKPYEDFFSSSCTSYIGCDIIQSNLNKVDILSPADNIPLEDNSFDTVFSTQTIEHVENYQGLVDEAYRLLKKGGFLILSGPFNWQLHEEPYDFFRFSKHGFTHVVNKSGFELVELNENGGMWSVVGQYLLKSIYNDHRGRSKKLRFLFKIVTRLKGVNVLNRIFEYLDKKDYNSVNTINYVVIARK